MGEGSGRTLRPLVPAAETASGRPAGMARSASPSAPTLIRQPFSGQLIVWPCNFLGTDSKPPHSGQRNVIGMEHAKYRRTRPKHPTFDYTARPITKTRNRG